MKNIFGASALALLLYSPVTPATAQDKSNEVVENIYKVFQKHAQGDHYESFQRSLMNNGALYIQSRKNLHVFMSAIGSNEFDNDDFRKRLNLTTCAAFSISKLVTDSQTTARWNIDPKAPLINLAPDAIENIAIATNGASNNIDCRKIYNRYLRHIKYINPKI